MNKESKYYFPVHLDGGNRGCEGIAKGTALILGTEKNKLVGLCTDVDLDNRLGLGKYVTLFPSRKPTLLDKVMFHVYPRIMSGDALRKHNYHYWYDYFLDEITTNDVMLSTGGDMLCYDNNFINYTNNKLHQKGVKTALWGCSMGAANLTPEKEETLRNFSLIYARESLTEDFFKGLGLKNVYCYPDPAFLLQPEETDIPDVFQKGEVIGVNISNFVLGGFDLNTAFGKQVKALLDYVIAQTDLHILLIPHVLWNGQDDRIVARNVKEMYSSRNRISILDVEQKNYCQIRYVISKCKYFIGARTHAVVSAYSTCVPSLALGYSIKSKGIAKDLGIPEEFVVNSKKPKHDNDLLDSFISLCQNDQKMRTQLESVIPEYCQKPFGMREVIEKTMNL